MRIKFKPFMLSLCILGFTSLPLSNTLAYSDSSNLAEKIDALQNEVAHLKSEMRHQKNHQRVHSHAGRQSYIRPTGPGVSSVGMIPNHPPIIIPTGTQNFDNIVGPDNLPVGGARYLPIDFDVPGDAYVTTGPYLGVPLAYNGSDLIINTPSVNQDVALMKLRKNINERLMKMGICPNAHSHLILSGSVEGVATVRLHGNSHTSDIDLSGANLDAYVLSPSNWISGLIAFSYESDVGAQSGALATNTRVSNSRVFINKAFVTIGDLACSPFYLTMGQMYVPFGTYSSNFITSPLTKPIGRIKARAILLGYYPIAPNNFYGSLYGFRGDSFTGAHASQINNGGINVGYRFKCEPFSGDIGGGVVRNIADSQGMQFTGNYPFWGGFGSNLNICGPNGNSPCGNEQLAHVVPGVNARGLLSIGDNWDFLAEYVGAARRFAVTDMTFDNHGAAPRGLNAEAAYSFKICDKPSSFVVGYGQTWEALAIGLPQKRYAAVFNTSIWRNTLQSLEFRHDINYGRRSSATGSGIAAPSGTGNTNDTLTAQFALYF